MDYTIIFCIALTLICSGIAYARGLQKGKEESEGQPLSFNATMNKVQFSIIKTYTNSSVDDTDGYGLVLLKKTGDDKELLFNVSKGMADAMERHKNSQGFDQIITYHAKTSNTTEERFSFWRTD